MILDFSKTLYFYNEYMYPMGKSLSRVHSLETFIRALVYQAFPRLQSGLMISQINLI